MTRARRGSCRRRVEANRLNGIDAEWLEPNEVKEFCPPISISPTLRYPVIGATLQRSGGANRHDAVVWGYARAADAMGVDIIQQCEVTNILTEDGAVTGVETTRGTIRTPKVACVTAGHTSVIAKMVGLQAADREPSAAGARLRADEADPPLRRDVERRARLCQPVRQGRARHRRRHRPLLSATRSAARSTSSSTRWRR